MTTVRFALSALCCLAIGQFAGHTTVGALTFTAHTVTNDFAAGRDVCVEDMNRDGRLDIVAGGGYEVSWWENLGYNSFVEHIITDQVSIARSVRAADVDGDGEVDVVGATWQQDRLVWWKNDGDENFTEIPVDEAFVGPHTVDLKDLNGDGRVDILCSGFDMSDAFSEIAWWENAGNDSFVKHVISDRFQQSPFIFGESIDDDEHMDVLACGEVNDEVVWWRNDGQVGFTGGDHMIDSTYDAAHTVLARDLDRDGDMDILGTACISSQFTWWENDGAEQFQKHHLQNLAGALWIDAVDLDQDGDNDLIGAGMGTANVAWWENDGYQNFTQRSIPGTLPEAYCVVSGDMDSDGDADLVGIGRAPNRINWYENDLATAAPDLPSMIARRDLLQNDPNPFSAATSIQFSLEQGGQASVQIYDLRGREISTLLDHAFVRAGVHVLRWDGTNRGGSSVPAGVYLYRLRFGEVAATRSLTVTR
jgi:hypothetical protein